MANDHIREVTKKVRLIDANALIEHLTRCIDAEKGLFRAVCVAIKCFVEQMPTVDAVEVAHGRWMKTCLPDIYHCTNCKRATKMDELCDSEILRAYCPNCGADMRGYGNG